MTPRDAGRIARRYGVQLFDDVAVPHAARWCSALVVDGVALVAHRRTDTPAELRARCRWASKRVRAMLSPSTASPFALVFIVAALALAPSCAADPPPVTACTPGAQVSCGCPAGAAGVQVCAADGSSLGACMCSAADAGADAATDASPAADGDAPDAAGLDAAPLDGQGPADAAAPDAADVFQGVDVGGPCLSLLAFCNGRCVDLRSDARNCHACGNVCAEGVCREGECVAADAGR